MAILNFPNSPTDKDQTLQPNGVTYQWNAAKTRWDIVDTGGSGGQGGGGDTILPSPPADPSVGDGWWDDNVGKPFIWYDDGSSAQWVERVPGAIPTEAEGGKIISAPQVSLSGAITEVGSIPDAVRRITISVVNGSGTSAARYRLRWGTVTALDSADYAGTVMQGKVASSGSTVSPTDGGYLTGDTVVGLGNFCLIKIVLTRSGDGNLWLMSGSLSNVSVGWTEISNAEHTVDGGPLNNIGLSLTAGTWDTGTMQVTWEF